MTVVIQAAGLGKRYRLGQGGYVTLREKLDAYLRPRAVQTNGRREVWALRDVDLEIDEGDVVGIVGRNGAGKTTFLKTVARIVRPTTGVVRVRGRVGALLEVGTGFHPELTGRENVFLNGVVLGMSRREIRRRFDDIVEFAGVERFLETPLKRYSSGMYLRLAFAVAAHMDPDVIIVDEVLAVGDAEFQSRCLGRMSEFGREGRTVLFVSHQMNAVQTLCPKTLWLHKGRVEAFGPSRDVIARYLTVELSGKTWTTNGSPEFSNPYFTPTRMSIVDRQLRPFDREIGADEEIGVLIEGMADQVHVALTVGFALYAAGGELLFWALQADVERERWPAIRPGRNRLVGWVPAHLLNEGDYRVDLHAGLYYQEWFSRPGYTAVSVGFRIQGGLSKSPYWMMARPGLLAPIIPFEALDVPKE